MDAWLENNHRTYFDEENVDEDVGANDYCNNSDADDVSRPLQKTRNNAKRKKKEKKKKKNTLFAKRDLYVYPVHVTEKERKRHVNLLLHSHGDDSHYSGIRNFSALMNSQYSRYRKLTHYCYTCLRGFANVAQRRRSCLY